MFGEKLASGHVKKKQILTLLVILVLCNTIMQCVSPDKFDVRRFFFTWSWNVDSLNTNVYGVWFFEEIPDRIWSNSFNLFDVKMKYIFLNCYGWVNFRFDFTVYSDSSNSIMCFYF